jgi:hypothetical protein
MSDAPITERKLDEALAPIREEMVTKRELQEALAPIRAEMVTKRELQEALTPIHAELAQVRSEMLAMESRLARQIGEAASHFANVVIENTRSQIAALDDKYRDVPPMVATLRTDLDAHVADPDVHVKPIRPRARRTRRGS